MLEWDMRKWREVNKLRSRRILNFLHIKRFETDLLLVSVFFICWSYPIDNPSLTVLSSFSIYYLECRSELCDPKPSHLSYLKNEHICGRPLGLRFDKRTGDLYIADAYFGLMKVGPQGGLATLLTNEAEGVPLRFTNDLDVDDEGNIYFTDSSTKFQRR